MTVVVGVVYWDSCALGIGVPVGHVIRPCCRVNVFSIVSLSLVYNHDGDMHNFLTVSCCKSHITLNFGDAFYDEETKNPQLYLTETKKKQEKNKQTIRD